MILCSSGVFFHRADDGRLFVPGDSDLEAVVAYGPRMPVDGIELLVTRRMVGTLGAAADLLSDVPLRFPVIHGPKLAGAALPDEGAVSILAESAAFASRLGAHSMVLHLWDLPDSDVDMAGRLDAVVVAADVAADHGIRLLIETIPCVHGTPLKNLRLVVDHEPRVAIALDTEFLAMHDELDEALATDWLWAGGLVGHIHLKDFDGSPVGPDGLRRYLVPGNGGIDFGAVFDALGRRGFSGSVSLEAVTWLPDGRPDIEEACRAIRRLGHSPWSFT